MKFGRLKTLPDIVTNRANDAKCTFVVQLLVCVCVRARARAACHI
jgi:hypothetical protein